MRVKISIKEYDVEKLVFGNKYYMAYAGATIGEEFLFTRKKRIEMCEFVNNKKVSSYWVSKRQLKQTLNSGCIHWIAKF